mgnify:FL=1
MKLLNNESEYREWMTKDYLYIDDGFPQMLEAGEIENELVRHMPVNYPCIVLEIKGMRLYDTDIIEFIYRSQVEEWAKLLAIIH